MSNSLHSFFTRELLRVATELLLLKERALTVPDHEDARDSRRRVVSRERPRCQNLVMISLLPDVSPLLVEFSKNSVLIF